MSRTRLNLKNPIRDAITRMRFAPMSNNLLISSWDSTLRLYDVDGSKLRGEFESDFLLLDCCFGDEGEAYAAGSDGSVCRFDLRSGNYSSIGKHDSLASCSEYSDETSLVITGGWDRKVMHWDSRATQSFQHSITLDSEVDSISICSLGFVVSAGASVHVYDFRNIDEPIDSYSRLQIKCVRSIPYLKGFTMGSIDGRVTLHLPYMSNTEKTGYAFRCHPKSINGKHHLVSVNDISFNPFISSTFVTGDNLGHVIAWDARSRKRLLELPRYPNSVASLSYNQVGELLAVASSYTYQEANEIEDPPQIFIQELSERYIKSVSSQVDAAKSDR
ncbi:Mitotic checkpoint protein BUB3.3-like protein [Drosera capensis]